MPVIISFLRTWGIFHVKRRCCTCTASIFPLCFRGQPVSVCTAVPAYILSINRINRLQPFLFAICITERNCLQPCDIFHWKVASREIARIASHDRFILCLCHLIRSHIKIADRNRMLCFIITAPAFCIRASHLKRAACDTDKAIFYVGFLYLYRLIFHICTLRYIIPVFSLHICLLFRSCLPAGGNRYGKNYG